MASCSEKFGDKVDKGIGGAFERLGLFVGGRPRLTILLSFVVVVCMGAGFATWEVENRPEKLWVPQGTAAETETEQYQEYFASTSRFNTMIVGAASGNVLTKANLESVMSLHQQIETGVSTVELEPEEYTLTDLCTRAGGSCASGGFEGICSCLMSSILRMWDYDLATLQADQDYMTTLNNYGSQDDLSAVLGQPEFDASTGELVAAKAMTLSYFLENRAVVVNGNEEDPINDAWEEQVFLAATESVPTAYPNLNVDYFAGRSFNDEFGEAISGDLTLVQISYVVAFLFLGATMGKIRCGTGSRWTMALAAVLMVGLSTAAGFGLSSLFGLFFGPVHSLLPFILLGIGVDDAFVIVNAFNRERKIKRTEETNADLRLRSGRALARAGASITVTSATDLVAFAISSSSSLPALASFCAFAAIAIFFLYTFASTFFSACLVLDERRQRDNRRECLCCVTRSKEVEDEVYEEGMVSRYFRNYHAPAILSKPGKAIVMVIFSGLLAFGIFGAMNLSVEDSQRSFVPEDSYLVDYLDAADKYFPDQGIDVDIVFEGSSQIYASRQELSQLDERLTGLSQAPPYLAEPVSEEAYRNVMTGFGQYLSEVGTASIGNMTLGDDNWPTSESDFVTALEDGSAVEAIQVRLEYIKLTREVGGEIVADSDKQIDAMDATRELIASWDDLPPAFPYSENFITIEGFKIIRQELFTNVGLAIAAVGIIVFCTIGSAMTTLLITACVAFCIVEILGFMWALGIVIDSVSVINIVLAVGLSVDYSAHVGHCFMVKGGDDKDNRAMRALADIGAAVLSGATSTFLAVVVLLFSTSYVFEILSRQFALTVILGVLHGLVLLPVLLAVFGPKPFSSAEMESDDEVSVDKKPIGETDHPDEKSSEEES